MMNEMDLSTAIVISSSASSSSTSPSPVPMDWERLGSPRARLLPNQPSPPCFPLNITKPSRGPARRPPEASSATSARAATRAQQGPPSSSLSSIPRSFYHLSSSAAAASPSPSFPFPPYSLYPAPSASSLSSHNSNHFKNTYSTPITIPDDDDDAAMARSKPTSTAPRRSSGRVSAPTLKAAPQTTASQKAAAPTPSPRKSRSLRPRKSLSSYIDDDGEDDGEEDEDAYSDQENDDEEEEDAGSTQSVASEPAAPQPERGAGGRHSLRPRESLLPPEGLRDYISTDSALGHKKRRQSAPAPGKGRVVKGKRLPPGKACVACRASRRKCDRKKPRCSGCVRAGSRCFVKEDGGEDDGVDWVDEPDKHTVRGQIRKGMEETAKKRERFLIQYGHLFEALLPENNYIAKLRARYSANTDNAQKTEDTPKKEEDTQEIPISDGDETEVNQEEAVVSKDISAVPYKLLENQPPGVTATMKGYQLSGLSFLVWLYHNGSSGILGDEMGLGKTLQTLSLFSYLTTYHPCPSSHRRPFLVVCPLSVVSSWVSECKKWTPHLRVLRLHGPSEERERLKKVAESGEVFGLEEDEEETPRTGYDVVITSYEVFEREKQWFRRAFVWRYVVLDEGHKIKNEKTNIAGALQGLSAEYRLILTGTPLQNNLTELWALIHWLFPEVFGMNTSKVFSDAFDLTAGKNDLTVMDYARRLLELIMLRRMKESKGVNLGLPAKTEVVLYLPLVPMQRFWYKRLLTRLDKGMLETVFKGAKEKEQIEEEGDMGKGIVKDQDLEGLEENGEQWGETRMIVEKAIKEKTGTQWQKLMNLLMQLRKCCSHPYLLPNAEPFPPISGPHVILASSKFILLDKLIEELCIKRGQKVLIFSGFTKMLDICEDLMALKGGDGSRFKYGRLDGMTARARRNLAIRLFNSDPDYKVMLISTRAGGLGINLASASNVVMLDSDWNPQADLQAQARAHRIGQTQEVTVYRLITQGTVEEQMMGRIRKKLYLSAKVTESMRDIHTSTSSTKTAANADDAMPNLTTSQLMSLVRSGSRAIAREEIDPAEMLKWDWDTMIGKCRDYSLKLKTEEDAAAAGNPTNNEEEEKKWLSEMEKVETRVFEGKNHVRDTTKRDSNIDISAEWTRESRRLGMERVVMVDGHPVLKETIGNNEWEAVATMSGKDPRLAEPEKRKRKTIEHQDYCQVCYDGGDLLVCSGCPRTYHHNCLTKEFQVKTMSKTGQFYCSQHQCADCSQKTTNAGGMLFRCRWCESAYCEDCLDFDRIDLIGDNVVEYEILGAEASNQAFYIKCEGCIQHHENSPESREMCEFMETEWKEVHTVMKMQEEAAAAVVVEEEEVGSMTEGTTAPGSEGVLTPAEGEVEPPKKGRKKKLVDLPLATPALALLPAGASAGSLKRKKTAGTTPGKGGVKKKVKVVVEVKK